MLLMSLSGYTWKIKRWGHLCFGLFRLFWPRDHFDRGHRSFFSSHCLITKVHSNIHDEKTKWLFIFSSWKFHVKIVLKLFIIIFIFSSWLFQKITKSLSASQSVSKRLKASQSVSNVSKRLKVSQRVSKVSKNLKASLSVSKRLKASHSVSKHLKASQSISKNIKTSQIISRCLKESNTDTHWDSHIHISWSRTSKGFWILYSINISCVLV